MIRLVGGQDYSSSPEESWLSKTETDVLDKDGKVIPGMKWVAVRNSESVKSTTIPEFTGRVFRD